MIFSYTRFVLTQITDVFVGVTRKLLLDQANPDLALTPVIVQFGRFLKIIVSVDTESGLKLDTVQWRIQDSV